MAYQTTGITWWADYNLTYAEGQDANSCKLDVGAWVSILNQSGASYPDAKLKLIAGDVHRAPPTPAAPMAKALRSEAVADEALVIYRLDGQPLPEKSGGPVRFFIPDFAACHTHEIDECANVKFVDRIEFTTERGFDNRPHDGDEHAALHAKEQAH